MNTELGPNTQAILLLTAPLLAGKTKRSVKPLSLGEFCRLERHLREMENQPADLLNPELLNGLEKTRLELDFERVRRLLGRGFLLALAVERWRARAIWIVTRADHDYPKRLTKRLQEKAPPVLYGCGNRDLIDRGGLAVVGSRNVSEDLLRYTERTGHLAAEAHLGIVSGGARGIDQAAMRGALAAGGQVIGVLSNGLEQAVLNRDNRAPLMEGQVALVCPYDPAVRFQVGNAMQRNKLIYALADAALVVNSDHERGGTWAGATEQLNKYRYVPVYVRRSGVPCVGLDALVNEGAKSWPDPKTPIELRDLMSNEASRLLEPAATGQPNLLTSGTEVRETQGPDQWSDFLEKMGTTKRKKTQQLLTDMTSAMTRDDIRKALGLKAPQHVKSNYVDPCLAEGLIEMTIPETPRSPNQRFRRTQSGKDLAATFDDAQLLAS